MYFNWTSTFKSKDSLSSTEAYNPQNYRFRLGRRLHTKTVHFHFPASCMTFTPGHHHEESTILGETPLKEQAPAASYQTIFTKTKASPPHHLQPSPGSTCRISTSLLVLLKKSRGRPPSWKVFKNYLPIFYTASSPHGRHPFHFSCS